MTVVLPESLSSLPECMFTCSYRLDSWCMHRAMGFPVGRLRMTPSNVHAMLRSLDDAIARPPDVPSPQEAATLTELLTVGESLASPVSAAQHARSLVAARKLLKLSLPDLGRPSSAPELGRMPLSSPSGNAALWVLRQAQALQATLSADSSPRHAGLRSVLGMLLQDMPPAQSLYSAAITTRLPASLRHAVSSGGISIDVPLVLREATTTSVTPWSSEAVAAFRTLLLPDAARRCYAILLRAVVSRLQSSGIRVWATGGTLLGAVRHKGMIPWDDDLDLCVAPNDGESPDAFDARLRDSLCFPFALEHVPLFGYKCYSAVSLVDTDEAHNNVARRVPGAAPTTQMEVMRLAAQRRRHCIYGVFVDLFVLSASDEVPEVAVAASSAVEAGDAPDFTFDDCPEIVGDCVTNAFVFRPTGIEHPWGAEAWRSTDVFPLRAVDFEDVALPVPRRPGPYLAAMYGRDWNTCAVIPAAAHGRRLDGDALRFPVDALRQVLSPGTE